MHDVGTPTKDGRSCHVPRQCHPQDPSSAGRETHRWRRGGAEPFRAYARMSAVSGIVFAGLFVASLVLVRQAPGIAAPDRVYADFYTVGKGNVLVTAGLYVVPFAGIAYLWHMSATRTLIESLPGSSSEVPRWLQLASGVLFVCMLFAGTAAVGAVALLTVFSDTPLPSPEVARTLTGAGYGMVFVFGVRAAGMYMITTTTWPGGAGCFPRCGGRHGLPRRHVPARQHHLPPGDPAGVPRLGAAAQRRAPRRRRPLPRLRRTRTGSGPADSRRAPPPSPTPTRGPAMSMTIDLDDDPRPHRTAARGERVRHRHRPPDRGVHGDGREVRADLQAQRAGRHPPDRLRPGAGRGDLRRRPVRQAGRRRAGRPRGRAQRTRACSRPRPTTRCGTGPTTS